MAVRNAFLATALAVVLGGIALDPSPPAWWQLLLAIAVGAVAHQLRQVVRTGPSVYFLSWGEAALVVMLFLLPPGWVPLGVGVGFFTAAGMRWLFTRDVNWWSIPETAANLTIAGGLGALVSASVAVAYQADRVTWQVMVGVVLAAGTYLASFSVGVGLQASRRFGVPMLRVPLRLLRHKLPMSAGNVAIGVTAVVMAQVDWRWLLLLPAVLWALHRMYSYQMKIGERRRTLSVLASATRSLNHSDQAEVATAAVRGALETFVVARAAVVVGPPDGPYRTWEGDQTGAVRELSGLPSTRSPTDHRRLMGGLQPRRPPTAVPLRTGKGGVAHEVGQLWVYFPDIAGPSDGDQRAVHVYAAAVAAALHDTATHEELHRLLAQSAYNAQHDPLTRQLNRTAFLARAETMVQLAPEGQPVSLLLVDVDHFREINDTLGHSAGDQVLAITAQRLREMAHPGELLGRLGGNEFGLLSTDRSVALPARATERGKELVSRLAEEARIGGLPVAIEASVGVVVAPAGTADMAELLRRGHAAVREAKQSGGAVGAYDIAADPSRDRPSLLADLRAALDREGELVVVFQPVVDLATGAALAAEALVRWHHPRLGELLPGKFVRAVENSDLLRPFTSYVLDHALAAAAAWSATAPELPVAVNLSARCLRDPDLPGIVSGMLRKHRLPGRRLVLEVTETAVANPVPELDAALTRLRALGVRLAVDDFGTGHASLTSLTRMPLDEVKVDGSFVAEMAVSAQAAAIVRTTVELGRELGIRVVAEGVETAAQREQLAALGCRAGQGFHLAVPASADRIAPALRGLGNGAAVPAPRRTRAVAG